MFVVDCYSLFVAVVCCRCLLPLFVDDVFVCVLSVLFVVV